MKKGHFQKLINVLAFYFVSTHDPPLLSFDESLYHLFAAPLSVTLYFPSPVSQACADILTEE